MRKPIRKIFLIGTTLAVVSQSLLVHAHGIPALPKLDYAIGPSIAYAGAPKVGNGPVVGMDASGATWLLWAGLGLRYFETVGSAERAWLAYAEAGFFCLLNVGGGYTLELDRSDSVLSGPHLFLGLPWPITRLNEETKPMVLFFEPYYRPTFTDDGTLHEAGILLKLTSWSGNP